MSVFEEACYLSNQRWASTLPTEFEPVAFSKKHQKRMKILFDKMRRDKYHQFTRKATIALKAAIFLISMTVTAFAIPATRDFIIQSFSDHSQYIVADGEHKTMEELHIGYLPEGFEITEEDIIDESISLRYDSVNDDSWFLISKASPDLEVYFDTEEYPYEEVAYNGVTYIYQHNSDGNGYLWNRDGVVYSIYGNLTKEELLQIAASVT